MKSHYDTSATKHRFEKGGNLQLVYNITTTGLQIDQYTLTPEVNPIELYGFADTSESAYGAFVYCKCNYISGDISIKLVTSKSQVAPMQRVIIPRLELSAVLLTKPMS
ncbi:hypothetical protein NPIL_646711 [Nephila pilipes]|uniref:Uncharacterized protein n=1 Tax=Nephila pilipes TaxID=299642 RepID=A0A8X6JNW0_NEPPI|nr:hypothetical protein NPIL_646711 [Nephila pilipes]